MIRLYFKQAFHLLKENKLLSSISIIGTTLAIAMAMVTMITLRVTIIPFAPEGYHDRILIFRYAGFQYKTNESWQSSGSVSYKAAKVCFKEMTAPEAVTTASSLSEMMLVAKPAGEKVSCSILQVGDDLWRVFKFDFSSGYPFGRATFDAGVTKTIVSEDIAWQLFGTSDMVGETFLLNHSAYMICGVVRPVPELARHAYAQIWILSSSTDVFTVNWGEYGITGVVNVYILAKFQDNFPAVRMETERLRDRYMEGYPDYKLLYRGRSDTYLVAAQRYSANNPPAVKQVVHQYIMTLTILLVVSAVNLSRLTLSRMRKRPSEIDVRKTFGAPRHELIVQIFSENILYSLLGGVLGLILGYGATFFLGSMLFSVDFMGSGVTDLRTICMDLLSDPAVSLFALSVCFALNLLNTAIPAWRATRANIMDVINER